MSPSSWCSLVCRSAWQGVRRYLGVAEHDFLTAQGDQRSVRLETVPAYRGMVRDRHGEPLAVTHTRDGGLDRPPAVTKLAAEQLAGIAEALALDPEDLRREIDSVPGREFVYLRRQLRADQADALMAVDCGRRVPRARIQALLPGGGSGGAPGRAHGHRRARLGRGGARVRCAPQRHAGPQPARVLRDPARPSECVT